MDLVFIECPWCHHARGIQSESGQKKEPSYVFFSCPKDVAKGLFNRIHQCAYPCLKYFQIEEDPIGRTEGRYYQEGDICLRVVAVI